MRLSSHSVTLQSFALAGLGGGVLAGLSDVLDVIGVGGRPALGAVGVAALLGLGLGLAAGLVFPLVPPRLRAVSLLRRTAARLRPGDDDALHDRCRTVASVWMLGLGLPLFFFAVQIVYPILLGRIRSRMLAAAAVALVGLALTAAVLALAAPMRAAFARSLETLVRRRPGLASWTRPGLNLIAAASAGVLLWLLTRQPGGGGSGARLLGSALLLGACITVGGEMLHSARRRLPALALGLVIAGAAAWFGLSDAASRAALAESGTGAVVARLLGPPPSGP